MKKKTILHKLTAALLTGTLLLSLLTGCGAPSAPSDTGNSPETAAQPGSTASDLEPVTLKLWSCSDKYAAQDEILAKLDVYKRQLYAQGIPQRLSHER